MAAERPYGRELIVDTDDVYLLDSAVARYRQSAVTTASGRPKGPVATCVRSEGGDMISDLNEIFSTNAKHMKKSALTPTRSQFSDT